MTNEEQAVQAAASIGAEHAGRDRLGPSQGKPVANSKIPPLVVYNHRPAIIAETLKDYVGKFAIKMLNNNVVNVKCFETECYEYARSILTESGSNFYTYTNAKEKPKNFMIKGLPGEFKDDQILQAFADLRLSDVEVISIRNFQTRTARETGRRSNLFSIQITGASNPKSFISIKALLSCRITIENLLNKTDAIQCRRCQRFGHVANNCSMQPRCVKCAGEHESTNCIHNREDGRVDEVVLKCTGCAGSHTASFKKCPTRLKFIERKTSRSLAAAPANKNSATQDKRTKDSQSNDTTSTHLRQTKTYADQLKNKTQKVITNGGSVHARCPGATDIHTFEGEPGQDTADIFADCQSTFGFSFFELLEKAKAFNVTYSKLRPENRPRALIEFALALSINGP